MALIPSMVLKQLYTNGSLRNSADGVRFSLKNRLSDATVTTLNGLSFDGQPAPISKLSLVLDTGEVLSPEDLKANPVEFPLRKTLDIVADIDPLADGKHRIEVKFDAQPFGSLTLKVDDSIVKHEEKRIKIRATMRTTTLPKSSRPASSSSRSSPARSWNTFPNYSFDPHITAGNIENFTGVAQVPHRLRRPADHQRRTRAGRVHRADGHGGRHAGRFL